MKKLLLYALCAVLILCALPSCKASVETDALKIVATNFPSYDFARQLTKDTGAEVTMLLSPGGESHSYDPTPQDIIRIGNNFFMNLPPCLIIGIIKADVQGLLSPCTVGLF